MIKIAVDGPSGAGKSSLAKAIAKQLGVVYVDTGALYRAVGLYILRSDIDPTDADTVTGQLNNITVELKFVDGVQRIYLCGEDVSEEIRTPTVAKYASDVSSIGAVRTFLLDTQRNIAATTSVIMDGRDIGTVIMPDADVKIFLTASAEARALRRYNELVKKGASVSYDEIFSGMQQRDANDSGRAIAPAVPAEDAVILDNSNYSEEETLAAAMKIIKSGLEAAGKSI
ncbi:MAG: (d)CMP kinase [Clostridiales bacterium]|nr:(d)CMP kinase [Clostridiales bacterium]